MRTRRFDRDERGAAAVIFALTAIVLFGVGAFAVDIGQAYAKKSLEQTDVDVAVMAAAAELTTSGACNPEVIDKATEYLQQGRERGPGQEQYPIVNLGGSAGRQGRLHQLQGLAGRPVGAGQPRRLRPGRRAAGRPQRDRRRRPRRGTDQGGPGPGCLPFFAVQGCDYGQQSIRNDSGAPALTVPPLYPDTSRTTTRRSPSPLTRRRPARPRCQITLNGTGLNAVDQVGFTGAAGPPLPLHGREVELRLRERHQHHGRRADAGALVERRLVRPGVHHRRQQVVQAGERAALHGRPAEALLRQLARGQLRHHRHPAQRHTLVLARSGT